MKNIQSKLLAPIPNAAEFDRLMANVGLTLAGLSSGNGGSGGGTTVVNNYNTTEVTNNIHVSDCLVRLLFADPLREDTVVYSGDVSLIQYVAFDGIAAEVQQEEEVIAPEGTTRVDFIFNDTSFPIPNAKIPDNAFKTMELDTVILSGGIAAIGRRAFDETTINTLIAMGVTPPYLNGEIESRNVGIMVVPDVAVEVYGKRYNEMNITDMSSYIEGLF